MSASDMSYAVSALLECDTPAIKSSPTKDGDVVKEDVEEREALQAFNIAYDALNCSSSPNMILSEGSTVTNLVNGGNLSGNTGVGAGLRLAMSLQKSIMATAVNLVDRNAITRLRHFRYAYITCTAQDGPSGKETDQHHVFAKPLALTKLAHYLMDMHRENGKWSGNKARPLVLLAEKPRTNTYLVVGYEYPERTGDFVKNRFGSNFELAAKTMKGTFRFDSFDSNVVEVDSEDVQRFIEQLHYMLDSM
jgi:cell division control protein 45